MIWVYRTLRVGAWLLLILLSGVLATAVWLVFTPAGTQISLAQSLRYLPIPLEVTTVTGIAGRYLRLGGVRFVQDKLQVTADLVELAWDPQALLAGELQLDLRLEGVIVHLPPAAPQPEPDPTTPLLPLLSLPPDWQAPLPVRLTLQARQVTLLPADQPAVIVANLALAAELRADQLHLHTLVLEAPQAQVYLSGTVQTQADWPLNLALWWQAPTSQGQFQGQAQIGGSLAKLALNHNLFQPQAVHTQLSAQLFQPDPELRFDTTWQQFAWPPTQPTLTLGAGHISLQGRPSAWQLSTEVAQISTAEQTLHGIALHLQGQVGLTHALPLQVAGAWQVTLPQAPVRGHIQLAGQPQAYQLKLQLEATPSELPPVKLSLEGQGDPTQLSQFSLTLHTLDGLLRAQGQAAWQPEPRWQVQLDGADFNPGAHWREWPGKLSFALHSSGVVAQGKPQLEAQLTQLSGTLRGYPLSAQFDAQLHGDTAIINTLNARSGSATLTTQGKLAYPQLDATFKLDVPNLAHLVPQAQGSAHLDGTVGGKLPTPQAQLHFHAQNLKLPAAQLQLAQLSGNATLDASGSRSSSLQLDLSQLRQAATEVARLSLQGSGTPTQHQINLNAHVQGHDLASVWQGAWQRQTAQWQGTWQSFKLTGPETGAWQLATAWPISAAAQAVKFTQPGCFQQHAAQLCLQGQWQPTGFRGQVDLSGVDSRTIARLLPPELTWQGQLAGQIRAQGGKDLASLNLEADLHPQDGEFRYQRDPDTLVLRYQAVQVNAKVHNQALESTAQFRLASGAHLEAQLQARPLFGPADKTLLTGRVQGQLSEFGLLSAVVPAIEQARGKLDLDLRLGGTLAKPVPQGTVVLTQAGLKLPSAGLNLEALEFSAQALPGQPISLRGGVRSGEGNLSWQGQLTPDPEQGWPLELQLSGKQFQAINTAEAQVQISPELSIRHNRQGLQVRGTLAIPQALLTVRELPQGSVQVSRDAQLVNQAPPTAAPLPLDVEVGVKLGEDVRFSGFGLKAHLGGQIQVREQGRGAPEGFGDLRIIEGSYRSYGQNLSVRDGRIIFAGPLDNPLLQLQAERKVGEIVAGLAVNGSARAPQTSVYAKPPMEQSDALGYLILGRPLSGGGAGSGLAEAATAAGLDSAADLTQSTGQSAGLDEAGLNTSGGLSAAGLTLGKYLTPRLYASFGVGLFDAQKTLNLRYQLSKRLQVQVQSGTSSAVDLLYVREYTR